MGTMHGFPRIRMVDVIRLYNPREFRHWFDEDTMRFFGTLLPGYGAKTHVGNYFITRESKGSKPGNFTIRLQGLEGKVDTVGEFQAYASFADADEALGKILEGLRGAA